MNCEKQPEIVKNDIKGAAKIHTSKNSTYGAPTYNIDTNDRNIYHNQT